MNGGRAPRTTQKERNIISIRALVQWISALMVLSLTLCFVAGAVPAPTLVKPVPVKSDPQGGTKGNSPPPGTPGAPVRSSSPAQDTDYNLHVTADTLRYNDARHFLTLDGNVVFTHTDTQITSPHAEFYTDKQIGYFTGGARITQPGTTITCRKVSAYYAERKAILTGNVEAITERVKSASKTASSNQAKTSNVKKPPATNLPTVLLCNRLDYWWEKEEGDAFGDVKVRQGDRRAFSDRAHYIGKTVQQVHLYSNCRFERGDKDWMTSEEALIEMNTNTFTAIGNVEAKVDLESSPTPTPRLKTPQGDRVLKPAPPVIPDIRRGVDGLPHDLTKNPGSTQPAEPEEPSEESPTQPRP